MAEGVWSYACSLYYESIAWYANDGAGGFGPAITISGDGTCSTMAIGDRDVACDGGVYWLDATYSVLPGTYAAADTDADGLDPDTDGDGLLDGER